MNGQFQETPAISMSIPEDRKQQIIVVWGQMIGHNLTETSSQEEDQMRKDREHSEMMKHEAFYLKSLSCLKASGCPFHWDFLKVPRPHVLIVLLMDAGYFSWYRVCLWNVNHSVANYFSGYSDSSDVSAFPVIVMRSHRRFLRGVQWCVLYAFRMQFRQP